MTSFVKKKTHEKDVVGIVTFDLTGLLPSNHIIAYIYYNGISEFVTKLVTKLVNSKKAQTTQSI